MKNILKITLLLVTSLSLFSCEDLFQDAEIHNKTTTANFKSTQSLVGSTITACNSDKTYTFTSGEATVSGSLVINKTTGNINIKEEANQLTLTDADGVEYKGTMNNSLMLNNILFILNSDASRASVIKFKYNVKLKSDSGASLDLPMKFSAKIVINANGDVVLGSVEDILDCGSLLVL